MDLGEEGRRERMGLARACLASTLIDRNECPRRPQQPPGSTETAPLAAEWLGRAICQHEKHLQKRTNPTRGRKKTTQSDRTLDGADGFPPINQGGTTRDYGELCKDRLKLYPNAHFTVFRNGETSEVARQRPAPPRHRRPDRQWFLPPRPRSGFSLNPFSPSRTTTTQ